MRFWKKTIFILTSNLVLASTFLLVGELGLRTIEAIRGLPPRISVDNSSQANQPNSVFRWQGNPGTIKDFDVTHTFNYLGFNDEDYPVEKRPNTFRIAVLGDSFTEAFQVPRDQSFHTLLEKKLNEISSGNRRFEVLAFGRSGQGTRFQLEIYEKLVRYYNPDLVISTFFPFFLGRIGPEAKKLVESFWNQENARSEQRIGSLTWIQSSRLNTFLAVQLEAFLERFSFLWSQNPTRWVPPIRRLSCLSLDQDRTLTEAIKQTRLIYNEFGEKVEADGALLLPAYFPTTWEYQQDAYSTGLEWLQCEPEKIVGMVFDSWGSTRPFLNTTLAFQQDHDRWGEGHVFPHDRHWNARGHRIAAQSLFQYVSALLAGRSPGRPSDNTFLMSGQSWTLSTSGPEAAAEFVDRGDAKFFRLPVKDPKSGDYTAISARIQVKKGIPFCLKGYAMDRSAYGNYPGRIFFQFLVDGILRWERDIYAENEGPEGLWKTIDINYTPARDEVDLEYRVIATTNMEPWGFGEYSHTGLALLHLEPTSDQTKTPDLDERSLETTD